MANIVFFKKNVQVLYLIIFLIFLFVILKVLMRKGKRGCASFIQAQCSSSSDSSQVNLLLDKLLNPLKPIDDWDTIDWIKWLIAGGRTPSEFQVIGRLLLILNKKTSFFLTESKERQ